MIQTQAFFTGSGWINSPVGAYANDLTLIGKANFGFNSQYKKGSSTPTGNTEFQFQAGNLNFKSSTYNAGSLVVAGTKAIYKRTGTINGGGNYGFMVSVIDGQANGGSGKDRFRIKIWQIGGEVVYDNQLGDDNAELTTAGTLLGGGSKVIHQVNGTKTQTTQKAQVVMNPELTLAKKLTINAYPNPAVSHFNLKLESNNRSEAMPLKVFNQLGQVVEVKRNVFSDQVIQVGAAYKQGTYFVEVTQGTQKQNLQLVKTN